MSSSNKFASLTPRNNYTDNSDFTGQSSRDDLNRMGYKIGNLIGEGSYCKVKSATYKGEKIAVKIISRMNLSVDFETRFLPREIEVLSQVKHKNICEIYQIFNYPNRVYIFMELIAKGDMLDYVRNRGRLTEEETCYFFSQMVNGLRYLHSIQVAHRDLKCENIMITDSDVLKIIDFGFCRRAVNDQGKRELSSTFCGSTAYAAPEVLQGIPYNPMMYDVWSMGCVLFIMITGAMPFDDSNVKKWCPTSLKDVIRIQKP